MNVTTAEKARLGARRCQHRRRIQEIMEERGIRTMRCLAHAVGLSDASVYRTLTGSLHSSKVLDKLREIGVPEQFICDPRRGKEAA